MNEKLIERNLRKGVKAKGGEALKLLSPYFTGLPDRIVLMPRGRIRFAEIKTTGKKLSPRQVIVIDWLRKMGFDVSVIDTEELLNEFLNEL